MKLTFSTMSNLSLIFAMANESNDKCKKKTGSPCE